jgi:DNA-3-methyladenine glycosylase II
VGPVTLVTIPQPYDFVSSTERFRAYGLDRATVWQEGALHRVAAGREVRIEPAVGGVDVAPFDAEIERHVSVLLGVPFDLAGFWSWANGQPVLSELAQPLAGYRPPLQPDRWEALVTSITAQQVSLQAAFAIRSRLIERFGERHELAWAFPTRERLARAQERELLHVGFSGRKAEYVVGLARSDLDLDLDLATLDDDAVVVTVTAQRGLGRWSADWFLARALARPAAWPAGDLGLRKAVSHFYGNGRLLSEGDVRERGARFGEHANLAAHMLLAGARIVG